jgi:hypothetical protein
MEDAPDIRKSGSHARKRDPELLKSGDTHGNPEASLARSQQGREGVETKRAAPRSAISGRG